MKTLRLPMPLPTLNDIITWSKWSPHKYGMKKRNWMGVIGIHTLQQGFTPITEPGRFEFEWHERKAPGHPHHRDPDNVSSGGRKIILDALQSLKRLPNDNGEWVLGFVDTFHYGGEFTGVIMTVR